MTTIPASPHKPYAESCDQNRDVILAVLKACFVEPGHVLEIASGTGQHAVFFAQHMPHLQWQPSDQAEYLPGIQAWVNDSGLDNIKQIVPLDVTLPSWPVDSADYIFSANSVHIMSWRAVQSLFAGLKSVLKQNGLFALYGPFNYSGQYTSASNERFDQWLKQRDSQSGIRDFEALNELARHSGLAIVEDYEMPANNRILVWKKA